MKKQQKGQAGFIVSAELVLIATIMVIGLIVGMVAIRDAVTAEMHDVAESIGSMDQSYYFDGISDTGTNAEIGASAFNDWMDDGINPGVEGVAGQAGDQTPLDFSTANEGSEVGP